jgi:hypothetical protein
MNLLAGLGLIQIVKKLEIWEGRAEPLRSSFKPTHAAGRDILQNLRRLAKRGLREGRLVGGRWGGLAGIPQSGWLRRSRQPGTKTVRFKLTALYLTGSCARGAMCRPRVEVLSRRRRGRRLTVSLPDIPAQYDVDSTAWAPSQFCRRGSPPMRSLLAASTSI